MQFIMVERYPDKYNVLKRWSRKLYFLHYLYVGIGTDLISVLLRMEEDIYEVKHSLGVHLVKITLPVCCCRWVRLW